MDWLTDPQAWIGLATLTALEIVLGIDNVIFISILAGKLPVSQQPRARRRGLHQLHPRRHHGQERVLTRASVLRRCCDSARR